ELSSRAQARDLTFEARITQCFWRDQWPNERSFTPFRMTVFNARARDSDLDKAARAAARSVSFSVLPRFAGSRDQVAGRRREILSRGRCRPRYQDRHRDLR